MASESSNGNGRIKASTQTVLTLIGWLVIAVLAYGVVNARMAVAESRLNDNDRRLQRMEDKLDRIWERIK